MSGARLATGMPDPMGAAPDKLKVVMAGRQNTLVLQDGEPVVVRAPQTWTWNVLNLGPGLVFARWDGMGYAVPHDPKSVQLASGVGYSGISAETMTFACLGATQITFSADQTGGFFVVGGTPPPLPPPPAPPAPSAPPITTTTTRTVERHTERAAEPEPRPRR